MNSITANIRIVAYITGNVEVHCVASQTEGLANMVELSILNFTILDPMHKELCAKLITANFVAKTILETSLCSESCSDSTFTFWQVFNPLLMLVATELNVTCE